MPISTGIGNMISIKKNEPNYGWSTTYPPTDNIKADEIIWDNSSVEIVLDDRFAKEEILAVKKEQLTQDLLKSINDYIAEMLDLSNPTSETLKLDEKFIKRGNL